MSGAGAEVVARLDELAALRSEPGLGADRPGLSDAEERAHERVAGWMAESGLEVDRDAAGNLYGRRTGLRPDLPELWCGSHLDTVPCGGRFDGALGVVAPLAALARLEAPPERTVAVVAFRDEEGCRFGGGFFGSLAATGALPAEALELADAGGVTVRHALACLGRALDPGAGWLAPRPAAYLELHVEQGPALARAGVPLGIVESIAACAQLEVAFTGEEGHAGTTPMDGRRDAGLCAAAFALAAERAACAIPGAVATVGRLALEPGAANVVPRRARLVVDARAPDDACLDTLLGALTAAATAAAGERGAEVVVDLRARAPAAPCDPGVRTVLAGALPGAPTLVSGAGHDAQVLAAAGVPVGMVFVRSLNGGISHSPLELTSEDDVEAAVAALAAAIPALCRCADDRLAGSHRSTRHAG